MSTSSVRIFGCPTCGFRVDTGESSCPRCGNEFREGTMFECPFCGDLVKSGLDECPSCHVSYSEFKERAAPRAADDSIDSLLMEIIKLESSTVKEEEKRFSCPKCDLLLEGTETSCPRCGKDLDVEIALQCPVCGGLVGARDTRCGECGTVFDAEAESAARSQEAESRLEEIMSIAGPSEPELPEVAEPEPEPVQPKQRQGEVEFASAMFNKVKEAVRIEPERRRAPEPPPSPRVEEEPVQEPLPREEPQVAEPVPEPVVEEAEPVEAAREAPVAAAPKAQSSGKKKTRKLKAKPKS